MLFGCHLQRIETFAEIVAHWLSRGRDEWAIDVVTENLSLPLCLSAWRIVESSSEDVEDAGFEEDEAIWVIFTDGLVDFFVGRQQVLVVGLSGEQESSWIGIEICSSWLVDELVAEKIRFF